MNRSKVSVLFLPSGKKEPDTKTRELLSSQEHVKVTEGNTGDFAIQYDEFVRNCDGDYVTVVNGGDSFPTDYFDHVLEKLEAYGEKIALVMTDKEYVFEGVKRKRVFLPNRLPEDEVLVNLLERKDCGIVPVFLNGTIIRKEVAASYLMNPRLGLEAEKEMLLRMSLEHPAFLYLQSVCYNYHTPREAHHYIYPGVYQKEWYYDSFTDFFLPFLEEVKKTYGAVPKYIQYVTAHYLICRLLTNENTYDKKVITEDGKTYMRSFRPVLQYIDDDILADCYHCPTYTSNMYIRQLLARLKYDDEKLWFDYCREKSAEGDAVLAGKLHGVSFFRSSDVEAKILFMDYVDGNLEMDIRAFSYFATDRVKYYVKLDREKYPLVEEMWYSHCRYFGITVYKYHTFRVSFPLKMKKKTQNISFWMEMDGQSYPLKLNLLSHTSRINSKSAYGYWRFKDFIAYRKKGHTIDIRPAKKWYTCYRELRIWLGWLKKKGDPRYFAKLRMLYFLTRPYFRRKPIWMFYDKIYKGGDSSEYLYKYSEKQDDGIKKYYLLDKDSADYKRMKREGYRPMKRNSLLHKLVFLNADMMIVSNSTVYAFNDYGEVRSGYIKDLTNFHVVCVQHGLSVQNIARAQYRLKDNTRLYFCASKYEIENLSRPIYNYVGHDALRLTGVPRYDGLVDEAKKQILISPTWRMQSAMIVMQNEGVERGYNKYFKETDYYRIYNGLINDPRLIEAAKEYGYRIAYVLHPIVSPQAKDFDRNDYVDVIPSVGDMSYEKLFRESALMVTDYSGVQFDFAYMRKPLVYLHHEDIPKHYEEGIFTYDTMAFGEICTTNDELIDTLIDYMKNGCKMKEEYVARADDFFAFRDHKNCERIYNEVIRYQHEVVEKQK